MDERSWLRHFPQRVSQENTRFTFSRQTLFTKHVTKVLVLLYRSQLDRLLQPANRQQPLRDCQQQTFKLGNETGSHPHPETTAQMGTIYSKQASAG